MTLKQAVHPAGAQPPAIHCSPGIRVGPYLFVSGQTATDWIHGRPPETRLPHLGDSVRAEVRRAYGNVKAVVEAAGMDLLEVARVDNYYTNRLMTPGHFAARDEYYPIDPLDKPASTAVMASRFLPEGCRYAVEGIAIRGPRQRLETEKTRHSPARIPMGIQVGDFVFLSGRMATDYREGLAPEARVPQWHWLGSPIVAQTRYILEMHRGILEAGGLSLADVVKSEVFLKSPDDITGLDETWADYFPESPPARSIFIVDDLGVTEGVIEINHIALHPSSRLERRVVSTPGAPTPLFYEPQAVKVGPLVFLSTQLAHDATGLAPEASPSPEFPYVGSSGRLEATAILRNTGAVLEAAGGSLADIVKVQTHLTNLNQFDAVNEVWKQAFTDSPPAWSVVEMRGPLPVGRATVLCDVLACIPSEGD